MSSDDTMPFRRHFSENRICTTPKRKLQLQNHESMKDNFIGELKEVFTQSKEWVRLQVEYTKLTASEKITIVVSMICLSVICLCLGLVVLILLMCALIETFKLFLTPALAYLAVSGIILLLMLLIYLLRKPLLMNPLAKIVTKLICNP